MSTLDEARAAMERLRNFFRDADYAIADAARLGRENAALRDEIARRYRIIARLCDASGIPFLRVATPDADGGYSLDQIGDGELLVVPGIIIAAPETDDAERERGAA